MSKKKGRTQMKVEHHRDRHKEARSAEYESLQALIWQPGASFNSVQKEEHTAAHSFIHLTRCCNHMETTEHGRIIVIQMTVIIRQ